MVKHPKNVKGYEGSLEQLAKDIGNLSYDQTAFFIEKFAEDIQRQADGDLRRGNKILAKKLYEIADKLCLTKSKMYEAWKICEPYMNE